MIGDSLYLMLENKMHEELLPTNGKQLVINAASFVEHMEEALSRVEITETDSHSCKDIGAYVKVLRSYIGFILDIVPDPASSFQLSLFLVQCGKEDSESLDFDDDNSDFQSDYETYHKRLSEFECKAAEYRTKLQALYDEIIAQAHCMDQFKMFY